MIWLIASLPFWIGSFLLVSGLYGIASVASNSTSVPRFGAKSDGEVSLVSLLLILASGVFLLAVARIVS